MIFLDPCCNLSLYPYGIGKNEKKPDEGLEVAWKAEINCRISEIDSGKVDMIPWEDVKMGLMKNNQ